MCDFDKAFVNARILFNVANETMNSEFCKAHNSVFAFEDAFSSGHWEIAPVKYEKYFDSKYIRIYYIPNASKTMLNDS